MKTLFAAILSVLFTLSHAAASEAGTFSFGGKAAETVVEASSSESEQLKCTAAEGKPLECRFTVDGEGTFVAYDASAAAEKMEEVKAEVVSGYTPPVVHVKGSAAEFYILNGKLLTEMPAENLDAIE